MILLVSFFYQSRSGESKPPGLTTLLIPASLFTGVLSCGFVCLLNPWLDRWLPRAHRTPYWLSGVNVLAGTLFVLLGLKGYWDFAGMPAFTILLGTVVCGWATAWGFRNRLAIESEHAFHRIERGIDE